MTASILDGRAIAQRKRREVAEAVEQLLRREGPRPGLAAILVGEDPASQSYVKAKRKACAEVGIDSIGHQLPERTSQEEVVQLVRSLNADGAVHGILVQLPLPDHIDEEEVLKTVALHKDVDGFHPVNIGRLAQKDRTPLFVPATPSGILELLRESGAELEGCEAIVLGRSNIVGMPTALLLVKENATVTICHSRTRDLDQVCRRGDVLIAAIGRAEMVRGDWIKPGATVIDVGVNRVEDPSRPRGYRLVGDVAFEEAVEAAGAITPVPGGVGPMTIAMLLANTLRAAARTIA